MYVYMGFSSSTRGKEPGCQCIRDAGSVSGLGRSPGGGHGNPLQYPCLENPMDRGAWWTTVHGVTKSWTRLKQLSVHTHIHTHTHTHTHTHVSHIQRQRERSTKKERNRDIQNTSKENHSQNVNSYIWIKWLQITFSVFFFVCFWLF